MGVTFDLRIHLLCFVCIVLARWLGLSLSLLLAAISRHSNFPSNRVGNSVKEHLIFAVNRVIATGSLSLKQIRKSSKVLILLPPITAQHQSVTPTTSVPSAGSAHSVQSPDKIKNDDTKILIGFRAGFSAS